MRLVSAEPFTIENEDGDRWIDDPSTWKEISEMIINPNDKLAAMTDEERAQLVDEISEAAVAKLNAGDSPRKCVVVLDSQYVDGRGFVPSVVVEGEAGHHPLTGQGELSEPWYWGHDIAKARKLAADLNAKLGLTEDDAHAIFESSIVASFREDGARERVDQKLGRRTSINAVDPRFR